jgi:hypothetical protein
LDADDKDPADNLADQMRRHEAKITENAQTLDYWINRVRILQDEVAAIRRQLKPPRNPNDVGEFGT